MLYQRLLLCLCLLVAGQACRDATTAQREDVMPSQDSLNPDWAAAAGIYEVNVRQYTPEGTLEAFSTHLDRLEELGVDILWFMPIFPISENRRKGSLGSYYAVSDFREVNPEFGTMSGFKSLVDEIHRRDMKVILDWVPNHTGWDHHWIVEHPDWYTTDSTGQITDPLNEDGSSMGWSDVADLNYDVPAMREAMIADLRYWIDEVGVDGYRMDVAWGVPTDFWGQASDSLRRSDPDIFMLAEAEKPELRNRGYFQMDYGWEFHHLLNAIARGEANADSLSAWQARNERRYEQGYHMQFITNHDENSWNGTVEERLGPAADAMAVLCFTHNGMPLIYSGQEAGLDKRLAFFEKDQIDWGELPKQEFYKTLLELKETNSALHNGRAGGKARRLQTSAGPDVFAFTREKGGDQVVVLLNLSDRAVEFTLDDAEVEGVFNNVFANRSTTLKPEMSMRLNAWDYMLLSNK